MLLGTVILIYVINVIVSLFLLGFPYLIKFEMKLVISYHWKRVWFSYLTSQLIWPFHDKWFASFTLIELPVLVEFTPPPPVHTPTPGVIVRGCSRDKCHKTTLISHVSLDFFWTLLILTYFREFSLKFKTRYSSGSPYYASGSPLNCRWGQCCCD